MAEYVREWKFRAWDPEAGKMYSPEDLEEPDSSEETAKSIYGQLIDGRLKIYDTKSGAPRELIPMQCTNWFDQEQYEVFEGDVIEIEENEYVVCWDPEISGYLLISDDGDVYPGGAYMTDVMKITGNIYKDKDASTDMHREWKYRAWDPELKKMYQPEEIKDPESDFSFSLYAYLSFGALYIYDFRNDPPMELIPMQTTGWTDAYQQELYEGDIVRVGGEIAQVAWSDEIGQFIFVANDGTLYPGSGQTAIQSEIVGNIYENPDVVPQF